jgi:AbrB family looped-hinge helix DNA binding protein
LVLPKDARKKLGLKEGDTLKLEVDERTKTIILQPYVEPPKEIFVQVGPKVASLILKESDKLDDMKVKRLLKALGAR